LKIGQLQRASEFLHKLVKLAPNDRDAWLNLSLCLSQQKLPKQQIFALQKLLEIDAQDGPALGLLADALFFEKQFDEAMQTLAKLKAIAGWEVQAVCKWAFILGHLGRGMVAYMLLNKTVQKHERSAALWFMMAQVLSQFPEHRRQALTAAENAVTCLANDPRQLQPEERQRLDEMIRDFA
jgi:Flp pilus assembly protein TadD